MVRPCFSSSVLHPLVVSEPALHPEVSHDLGMAEAGVDDDRRLASRDQKPERGNLLRLTGLKRQNQEAGVQLDVAQI